MAYYNDNKEKCLAYQKEYYNVYREERIAYQREYNKNKSYKEYQHQYFQENKECVYANKKLRPKTKKPKEYVRKPLAQYKIDKLEAMLRRKLRQYNNSIIKENVIENKAPPVIFKDTIQKDTFPPLQGYIIKQDKFIMTF